MMMDVSKQMGDPALNKVYTDHIPADIDWLEQDIGVKFKKFVPCLIRVSAVLAV